MKYVIGIDVGGTTVKLGIFNPEGSLLDKWEIETRTEEKGSHIISDIASTVKNKMDEKKIKKSHILGIGIDVPGQVVKDSIVFECVNLGWGKKNVSKELENILDIEVLVANDADMAALGEMWQGGGKGSESVFMITLGTGVGGGVVVDGEIITGVNGAAGEIGHVTVNTEEKIICNCGKPGCLEQYASATGITRLGNELIAASTEPSKLREFTELNSKVIFDCAKEGDKLALNLINTFGKYLGLALSYASSIVDPEVFVIGGGVSQAGTIIIDVTKEHYKNNVMRAMKDTKFKLAKLGNDAGIYGCAKLVLNKN